MIAFIHFVEFTIFYSAVEHFTWILSALKINYSYSYIILILICFLKEMFSSLRIIHFNMFTP